jgi:hypothetical protein
MGKCTFLVLQLTESGFFLVFGAISMIFCSEMNQGCKLVSPCSELPRRARLPSQNFVSGVLRLKMGLALAEKEGPRGHLPTIRKSTATQNIEIFAVLVARACVLHTVFFVYDIPFIVHLAVCLRSSLPLAVKARQDGISPTHTVRISRLER